MLRVLLQPIQRTIFALLAGGTKGQILQKKSSAPNDVEWVDPPDISQVNADLTLDVTSRNAVSNQAVAECLTWHEIN